MISVGETLPEATLTRMGAEGPEQVSMAELTKGRTVAIFAVPGAFTPTCHSAHVPSFIRNKDALAAKGVDEIICIAGNDPFVMQAWSEATGAGTAGITMLSDAECGFTDAIGMRLDAPAAGLIGRSLRYAMLARDGKVEVMNAEDNPGQCELSAGEALLDAIG
ncbi:peroxiredoxin [Phaeobacter gallaeciensis]|uniref:Glutathione-dependent peroxiredoxin n=1 Tax=Phaeobacter gallaeciensis TaxID=60890 RepID=A0AAD0EBP9_9RHOB|nr:peroxiredoxin [Phaeobacter gallaeciensis]AHD08294.1 thiol peroxidase (atypical 2-Cys peroxiredoxin) [Phaeobacter gallaeciensis DSM 26640]ATE91560.1 peroxiredoxin [Phaeobacter gallaeciensis]ATE95836.1 peroxiredoxin [Phaeobacter gallaeciensis]ATF00176.1 peroxiredoxin [Phaeobacter gallaeciensis]ATF04608.1 peroxiredoxin [Phaeobacter gallaeciensis]